MKLLPIKRAILSVTNKNNLEEFAKFLVDNNVEIISTGGTLKLLENSNIPVTAVEKVTGFPEILNGRVKTLHPNIHAGILANKDDPTHLETLNKKLIKTFDLVCVNLYDFASAIDKELSLEKAIEEIDIGGPCMLRAASKNFHSILVIPGPEWYKEAINEMKSNNMKVTLSFRQKMAATTFQITSHYDNLIANYLTKNVK